MASSSPTCQLNNPQGAPRTQLAQLIQWHGATLERTAGWTSPDAFSQRYKYPLVMIDTFTGWIRLSHPDWEGWVQFSSVQFSRSVMSDSLWPHGMQQTRPPCPSPAPGAYSNSYPWSLWYHLTISSSVIPFSSYLRSFPASRSFPMSQFFASGGQSLEF